MTASSASSELVSADKSGVQVWHSVTDASSVPMLFVKCHVTRALGGTGKVRVSGKTAIAEWPRSHGIIGEHRSLTEFERFRGLTLM